MKQNKISIYNLKSCLSGEIIDGPFIKYSEATKSRSVHWKEHNIDGYVSESFLTEQEFEEFASEFNL